MMYTHECGSGCAGLHNALCIRGGWKTTFGSCSSPSTMCSRVRTWVFRPWRRTFYPLSHLTSCVCACAQVSTQMWRPEDLLFNSSVIGCLLSRNLEPDWPMSFEASPVCFPWAMSEMHGSWRFTRVLRSKLGSLR